MRLYLFSFHCADDHRALHSFPTRRSSDLGGDVTTAPGGLEGLEAIRGHQFDVVITDVHMPRREGLWLWEQALALRPDRKSTRLNSSHVRISYAVFGVN